MNRRRLRIQIRPLDVLHHEQRSAVVCLQYPQVCLTGPSPYLRLNQGWASAIIEIRRSTLAALSVGKSESENQEACCISIPSIIGAIRCLTVAANTCTVSRLYSA